MKQKFFAIAGGLSLLWAGGAFASPVTFNTFVQGSDLSSALGQTNAIGFTYAGNKFVGSVYYGNNNSQLYQADLNGGNVQMFGAPMPNASGELYVSSSLGLGGFGSREVFAGASTGTIYKFSNDGSTNSQFITGLSGTIRGIAFDPYGQYGNDMIVTTNAGNVYRVNSSGIATVLASGLSDTEGLDFTPQQFGNIAAGTLVVVSEGSGRLTSIAPDGSAHDLGLQFYGGPEMLSFVPLNLGISGNPLEGFYAANYPNDVIKAGANQFASYLGDAVITEEYSHNMYQISWDTNTQQFTQTLIGTFPSQPEDGIFVTAAILNPGCTVTNTCAVPEPAPLSLMGLGLAGFAFARRKKA